jgi:hypothetical protein
MLDRAYVPVGGVNRDSTAAVGGDAVRKRGSWTSLGVANFNTVTLRSEVRNSHFKTTTQKSASPGAGVELRKT